MLAYFPFRGQYVFRRNFASAFGKAKKRNKSGMEEIKKVSEVDAQEMRTIYEQLTFKKLFREAGIVQLGCNVPLRSRELLGLKHDQFVTNANNERYIRASDSLSYLCTVNAAAILERDRLFQRNPRSQFLFPTHRGGDNRSQFVTRTTVAAALRDSGCLFRGRGFVLDDLRKVFGRRFLAEGGSLSLLRAAFNQASMQVTAQYLELSDVSGYSTEYAHKQPKHPLITIAPLYLAGVTE